MLDSFASVLFSSIPLAASSIGSVVQGVAASAWSILQVAIGLGFVIFVHELGHFLAAKFFGVKCEKFYIGFDVPLRIGPLRLPSALGKFQWGETEYGIGMIPLGGYVKMLGQDDDPRRAEQEAARIRQKTDDGEDAKVQLDPRSFPAKPVYARMIIISAGVVMNLIFAILMAAYAYRSGVPYQPTIVGGLMPGDPAWQAGIEPGDQVIQVVDMKKPNLRLPFMDMMTLVAMSGLDDKDRQIPIKVLRNGSEVDFSIVGTQRHDPDRIRTLLGIQSMHTTKFVGKHPIDPFMLSEVTETPFGIKTGDVVVAIDGYELPKDERLGAPLQNDLYAKMSTKLDSPVTLKLKRTTEDGGKSKDEFLEATIPPLAMKTLGLQFAVDGVAAIRKGSLAEKAGIEVGDQLLEFNGKPIEDGMTLRLAAIRQAGKEVVLKLRRANGGAAASEEKKAGAEKIQEAVSEVKGSDVVGKDYEVRWTVPTEPVTFAVGMQTLAPVGYDLPGLGMVYSVSNEIIGVQPGSKAAEVGLMPGDRLKQIQLEPSEKLKEELKEFFRKESFEARPIDNFYTALWTHEFLQSLPLGCRYGFSSSEEAKSKRRGANRGQSAVELERSRLAV